MPTPTAFLNTGQRTCHDAKGTQIPCAGSGQDAEYQTGIRWPETRFEVQDDAVLDRLTGLIWLRDANPAGFPLQWEEALAFIREMNREQRRGFNDWRMPNRRELRSLMSYQTRLPALPEGHPFENVFSGWYWSSTTAAIFPTHAWYVHMEGARMFYGHKEQFFLIWPVRGTSTVLAATGQSECFDTQGNRIPCSGTGQDGEYRQGIAWPEPRFEIQNDTVIDHLTGLIWMRKAELTGLDVTWEDALASVANLRDSSGVPWRLPSINELESLVDASTHSPALPDGHPFTEVAQGYWSSTTSMFEPDWAWALYLGKGATGVGQKWGPHFRVWAVRDL